jgi:flagellar basal body rod protein FlgG
MVEGSPVDTVGLYRVQGAMDRQGQALLTPSAGSTVETVEGKLHVGELEMGNATALESMVDMIGAQRHFETAMQAIQTYQKLDTKAAEVGRIR